MQSSPPEPFCTFLSKNCQHWYEAARLLHPALRRRQPAGRARPLRSRLHRLPRVQAVQGEHRPLCNKLTANAGEREHASVGAKLAVGLISRAGLAGSGCPPSGLTEKGRRKVLIVCPPFRRRYVLSRSGQRRRCYPLPPH